MQENNQIVINESLPSTHFFTYKGKKFPFNFSLFKYSSKYFLENKTEIKKLENIHLVDECIEDRINITDQTIDFFIKYCQREKIHLNNDNVSGLNYLAKRYEVSSLITDTNEYISNHHQDLALQILLIYQNDDIFKTDAYEDILSEKLAQYVHDDELLNLNFSIIYRIVKKYQMKQDIRSIIDFLFKCLDKYGREASVLFEKIDFCDIQTKYVNLLMTKYSKIFDFHFINSSILKSIYERQNEITMSEIENRSMMEKFNTEIEKKLEQKTREFKQKEEVKDRKIEKLESQMKVQEDSIKDLSNENHLLKSQVKNNEDEINRLKSENELFKGRLARLEKIFDEKEKTKVIEKNKNENSDIKTFVPSSGHELEGIFKYLTDKTGGNIHKNGTINVTSNSINGSSYSPENLLSADDNTYKPMKNVGDAWVKFDFKNMEIEVSHYSIKSCGCIGGAHVKNWIIEISNDGNKWETIDSHSNSYDLNGPNLVKTFGVKSNRFCRYCRFHHTGEYWGQGTGYVLEFKSIEFFGRLKQAMNK